jgi:hypothetical protein
MTTELTAHAWFLIFSDLSLDLVRPYLPAIGLDRPEDLAFAQSLQLALKAHYELPVVMRDDDLIATQILKSASGFGQEYPARLHDWARFIYPNSTSLQEQMFRWWSVVMYRAKRPPNDAGQIPLLVQNMRSIMSKFVPFSARTLHPDSEWDRLYCSDREDEGISPFEWIESAVRNYQFRYAWITASSNSSPEELEQMYSWANTESKLLRLPEGSLVRLTEL